MLYDESTLCKTSRDFVMISGKSISLLPPLHTPPQTHTILVQRQEGWCTWVLPLASPGPSWASQFDVTVVGRRKCLVRGD